ncbi:hypothetical protein E4K72_14160 [Oxalobacteraceae bacterium OM1]|nr:hypothetical protein E4K72_14160 [Oxalobacteraceae bacterium OM1]
MTAITLQPSADDAMLARPEPGHALGPVADDWAAVEVVLRALRQRSRSTGGQTEATYRFHLAKLRWYCEHVSRITPSRWSAQDAEHFLAFLAHLPADALCTRGAVAGTPGWTPFRQLPSTSSQADIRRFVHALFNAWHKMGYVRFNPMSLIGAAEARKVNTNRAIPLDLYDVVLETIQRSATEAFTSRQAAARDRFVFEALRGLGLRASELVGGRMNAFYALTVPKSGQRYWVFHVTAQTGKGGKARRIPVPRTVWTAFTAYRRAFGMAPEPGIGEGTRLLLSPRTSSVSIAGKAIKRTADRRFFHAWREITTRQALYDIVKGRLKHAADELAAGGNVDEAERLRGASPHWLRHTYGKATLLSGQDVREVAAALGHSSLETTMIYTEQDALDLIAAFERASPGVLASEDDLTLSDARM